METVRQHVVMTGASRGFGQVTVGDLAARGWRVICGSREAPPPSCPRDPAQGIHIAADLSKPDDVELFIKQANEVLGDDPLHALVNNAGVSPKTPYKERLGCLNGDIEAWRDVFELNFFTPLPLSRGFAAALHRGKRALCNITSLACHFLHPFCG